MEPHDDLSNFMILGRQWMYLMQEKDLHELVRVRKEFWDNLGYCGLSRSQRAAEPILTAKQPRILRERLQTIDSVIIDEVRERQVVVVNTAGTDVLRSLPKSIRPLTPEQERLRVEAIKCLERDATRAAIVMGWNFVYAYIRQWVFDNKLNDLNGTLPSGEGVKDYDDFFSGKPSERTFIDACFRAKIIGGNLRDDLRYYLRKRNEYAHANPNEPSHEQVAGYVKNLIDIISDKPFT